MNFARTGPLWAKQRPDAVAQAAQKDPAVREYLEDPALPMPEALAGQVEKAIIYNDSRSVKMTFTHTGVEPSLADRGQLREYLGSLKPEEIKALKLKDPDQYLATLKSIVRNTFPKEGELRYEPEQGKA